MNKRQNPFPSFQQQQPAQPHAYPPLPPGPPPHPAAVNQEWAAYWAAQQQAYPQPPQPGWPQPQPQPQPPQVQQQPQQQPQAPAYDPALYRNYGYGGGQNQQAAGWQQQAAAHPPAPQQYPHPHPQAYPQAYAHPVYAHQYPQPPAMSTIAGPPQPMQYGPQYPYPTPPQMPMHPQHQARPPPVAPPQQPPSHHQPPAKRPRFDSNVHAIPNSNIPPRPPLPPQQQQPVMPSQPPPLHFKPGGGMVPAAQLNNNSKFPLPTGPAGGGSGGGGGGGGNGPRGGGVALGLPGRGGGQMGGAGGRGGRGGAMGAGGGRSGRGGGMMHGHSGPLGGGMGRGGGMMGGRGGFGGGARPAPRGPAFRQNQSMNRFPAGSSNSQSSSKMHNPPTGPSSSRHERIRQSTVTSDTASTHGSSSGLPTSLSFNFTPSSAFRGVSPFSGTGKRTLTDFRIVGFGIKSMAVDDDGDDQIAHELDWAWGVVPSNQGAQREADPLPLQAADEVAGKEKELPVSSMEKLRVSTASAETNNDWKPAASSPSSLLQVDNVADSHDPSSTNTSVKVEFPTDSTVPSLAIAPPSPQNLRPANFKLSSTNSIPIMPRYPRKPNTEPLSSTRNETSRIRIYFQCPAELEDKDIGVGSSQNTPIKGKIWSAAPAVDQAGGGVVGGKRKKDAEDDDESDEEQKQRDGGKRKREDSTQSLPVKEGPEANGVGVLTGVGAAVKSPKSESEVEAEMHVVPSTEGEGDSSAFEIVNGAAGNQPHPIPEPGHTQPLMGELADDAESTIDFGMSQPAAVAPESNASDGGAYDMYADFDVDAEGEDAGDEDGDEDQWHNQMSWTVEGQTPVDPVVPFPAESEAETQVTMDDDALADSNATLESDSHLTVPDAGPNTATASDVGESTMDASAEQPVSPVHDSTRPSVGEAPLSTASVGTPESLKISASALATAEPSPTLVDNLQNTTNTTSEASSSLALPGMPANTTPLPSPNRLSISYAGSARRLVIDADVIESVKIRREEGRIDVALLLSPSGGERSKKPLALVPIKEEFEGDSEAVALNSVDGGVGVMEGVQNSSAVAAERSSDPASVSAGAASLDVVASSHGDAKGGGDVHVAAHDTSRAVGDEVSLLRAATPGAEKDSRGILIDALDETTQAYRSVAHSTSETDPTIPPFPKYLASSPMARPLKVRLVLYLDKEKPLSEPKWVKTGDIEDWLKSMFGQAKSDAQSHASWSGKIIIADPDPPPNVYALIDSWVQHSMLGPPKERRRFANDHMRTSFENVVEILLRLVRREGQPNHGSNAQPVGTLLGSALSPDSPYAFQQTHLSMAVLSLFRMSAEYAVLAGEDTKVLEMRVGQLVRSLPQLMVFKSLDGMFKEWMVAQKRAGGQSRG